MEISIHALLAESDRRAHVAAVARCQFLSTLSLRRATCIPAAYVLHSMYFYPRSPCGERLKKPLNQRQACLHFYPRSPCGERRHFISEDVSYSIFLSTLSLRRATHPVTVLVCIIEDFYPRSPCGERLDERCKFNWNNGISIHALLAESDQDKFSIPPAKKISIHALLAESDVQLGCKSFLNSIFLSTLSLRRATCFFCVKLLLQLIFLSTLSLRRATQRPCGHPTTGTPFLSTLSLRRATGTVVKLQCILGRFLSTLSLRRATCSARAGFC